MRFCTNPTISPYLLQNICTTPTFIYRISRPIRPTVIFSLEIKKKKIIYWKKTGLLHNKISNHKQWCHISWFGSKFHYLTIKMLYNRCMGIYKFGNNTYPRRIRHRLNLDDIFSGEKVRLMGREIRYILPIHSVLIIFIALNTFDIYNVNNFQGYLILNLNTSWRFCRCNDYAVMNNIHRWTEQDQRKKQTAYLLTSAWRIRGNYTWSFWCWNWEVNQDH